MVETVLYEFGFDWSKALGFIPIIFLGICFFFGNLITGSTLSGTRSLKDKSINPKIIKRILRSIGIFCWIVFVVCFTLHISEYREYDSILKKEEFLTVEGYVENFHPMPYEEHDSERFEIDGVLFEYGSASLNGYQVISRRGGVITENGQHLKIKYTTNEDGENVILYIAEIK